MAPRIRPLRPVRRRLSRRPRPGPRPHGSRPPGLETPRRFARGVRVVVAVGLAGLGIGCGDDPSAATSRPSAAAAAPAVAPKPPPRPAPGETAVDTRSPEELVAAGRATYLANCIACHALDPTTDGALGPAVAGSSIELLEARVMQGAYPAGYTPKRTSRVMIALPHLEPRLPELAAYLQSI